MLFKIDADNTEALAVLRQHRSLVLGVFVAGFGGGIAVGITLGMLIGA